MKIAWDDLGKRFYETGTDHGVLYVYDNTQSRYKTGVAWNGLISVTQSPSGADATDLWADNIKYASIRAAENFGATIEAYTFPDDFYECDGYVSPKTGVHIGQQSRKSFAFSYRTKIGNDQTEDAGYKLHIVYGATASPSEKAHNTVNDSPDAVTFSWEITTTPVSVTGYKPTAHLEIDSRNTNPTALQQIEKKLYGDTDAEPTLLLPDELLALITEE